MTPSSPTPMTALAAAPAGLQRVIGYIDAPPERSFASVEPVAVLTAVDPSDGRSPLLAYLTEEEYATGELRWNPGEMFPSRAQAIAPARAWVASTIRQQVGRAPGRLVTTDPSPTAVSSWRSRSRRRRSADHAGRLPIRR
jgi:hypothetical protein